MTYLMDTNILSEPIVPRPNSGVISWLKSITLAECFISALTIGEIKHGIEKLPDRHPRKAGLETWLQNDLLAQFLGRILVIDAAVMLEWGVLVGWAERQGRPIPLVDSLIAAQARYYQLTLVTRNDKDFRAAGCKTINPWE